MAIDPKHRGLLARIAGNIAGPLRIKNPEVTTKAIAERAVELTEAILEEVDKKCMD